VLESFCGLPPLGYKPLHLDGDISNNQLHNLRWQGPDGAR
jgi:hypothetical protein